MPNIRPEFLQATEDNLPNPYIEPQWPEDIPNTCPVCGKKLHPKINLSYGHGKLGRAFKWLAWWITMPWGIALFLGSPWLISLGGRGAGFAICILLVVPATIFSVLASISPRSRLVRCFPCKYSKDYPSVSENDTEHIS